jgi:hypothetical protein
MSTIIANLFTNPYQTDLRAFHGNRQLKEDLLGMIAQHREADAIIQNVYWELDDDFNSDSLIDGKGCAVGCSINSLNLLYGKDLWQGSHDYYEPELGIPAYLARLEDSIFEFLSRKECVFWPERFIQAIRVGADLSLIIPQFLLWLLEDPQLGLIGVTKSDIDKKRFSAIAELYRQICNHEPLNLGQIDATVTFCDADYMNWLGLWTGYYRLDAQPASCYRSYMNREAYFPINEIVLESALKLLQLLGDAPVPKKEILV